MAKKLERISERELFISRTLDAPRELVWEVWTNPEHIKHWWGPNGFTNTIHQMDVRPGGIWNYIMHGPDGTNYSNKSVYKEVVKPEKIIYDHISSPKFQFTALFIEQGDKTIVTIQMLFASRKDKQMVVVDFGVDEGLKQNANRLYAYVNQFHQKNLSKKIKLCEK